MEGTPYNAIKPDAILHGYKLVKPGMRAPFVDTRYDALAGAWQPAITGYLRLCSVGYHWVEERGLHQLLTDYYSHIGPILQLWRIEARGSHISDGHKQASSQLRFTELVCTIGPEDMQRAREAYNQAAGLAWSVFHQALQPIEEAYNRAVTLAGALYEQDGDEEVYNQAAGLASGAYDQAARPAREAYRLVVELAQEAYFTALTGGVSP